MDIQKGIIRKGIGGFYYVETAEGVYECRARGIFRKKDMTPYIGDIVEVGIENQTVVITKIKKRKNSFLRPPLANIDNIFIVCSTVEPSPSTLNLDKIIAIAEKQGINPILIITKVDLKDGNELKRIYDTAGIKTILFSSVNGDNKDEIMSYLKGNLSAFTGNSGVGKSTLLNCLFSDLNLETAPISNKLGRGKHTTRHTELYKIFENSYVADTPGFSKIDVNKYGVIKDEYELAECFREFRPYIGKCRFSSCSHTCEKDCAIIQAVNDGYISKSRFDSYVKLYDEIRTGKYGK